MAPQDPWDSLFPRDVYGRIALGLASLLLAPVSGLALFALLKSRWPHERIDQLFRFVTEEFLLGLFLFFSVGFVWACFTPRWLESTRESLAVKVGLGLSLFAIPSAVLAFWALFSV